jgi:hypothetical protein
MWEPRRLTILWASTVCYRESFTYFFYPGLEGRSKITKSLTQDNVSVAAESTGENTSQRSISPWTKCWFSCLSCNMTTNSQEVNTFRSISTGPVTNNHNFWGTTGHAKLLTFVMCCTWLSSRPACNRWRVSGPKFWTTLRSDVTQASVTRSNAINHKGTQFCWVVSVT